MKFFPLAPAGDYRVVSTDYETYSLVYACKDLYATVKTEDVWILSRTHTLKNETLSMIKDIIATQMPNYKAEEWMRVTQQDEACIYDPIVPKTLSIQ